MTWKELPTLAQEDLCAWFNSEPDSNDKRRLATLYSDGRFHAWDCVTCGTRVYNGDPEDWGHFQGVDELDFCSYPGWSDIFVSEIIKKQCNHCRCYLNPTHGDWTTHDDTGL